MTWRKSWAKNWDEVKFCSDACRRQRPGEQDRQIEAEILRLLQARGAGKTICPSEAARAVAGSEARDVWEPLMEPARAAARRLVAQGRIVITQGGHVVDASTAKGPIRLRLR
jgi:nucleoid-associated protein YgaU